MSEPMLRMEHGLAPYDDGSGHKVEITIEQTSPDAEPTLSIEAVFRLPASEWPAVARRIEHLLGTVEHTRESGR